MSNGTEQDARIALLDYFGSLARHWATVLLAVAVTFYSVVQVRKAIGNDWLFSFTLTMTAAGGIYAFLRMVTHGKTCELALDPKVRPRGPGTYASQMLHGMLGTFRTHPRLQYLDRLGDFRGFLCWTLGWVCAWFAFASLWALGFFPVDALQRSLVQTLEYRPGVVPAIPAIAGLVLFLLVIGFTMIRPETFQNEIERRGA